MATPFRRVAERMPRAGTVDLGETLFATAALIVGVILSALAYLRAFGAELRPLGPDLFGYIWQTRVVGQAPLSAIEARPGVPVLGSVLAGLGVTSDRSAALVLAPVLLVALGLAVAVALRLAFDLPHWTLGVLGFTVALGGGSLYLAQGHLANVLSLVCIVPTALLLAVPGGTWTGRMMGATATATASGLAHAGFLPFYGAAAGLWFLLSIPSLLRARREGARWWTEPSCSFLLALLVATALVAVAIFLVVGIAAEDFTNVDDGIADFGNRLAQVSTGVGLWVSATSVLAVFGIVAARKLAGPRSLALMLLGVAWTTVSAFGGLIAIVLPSFPGHRALAIVLPLAALAGLGIVWIAMIAGGSKTARVPRWGAPTGRVGAFVATFTVVALSLLVVSPGLGRLAERVDGEAKGELARTIASYVAAVDPDVPVVVFADPSQPIAALSWRGRQNQIRALVPQEQVERIFLVVGQLGEDLVPEQTVAAQNAGDPAFMYAMQESWSASRGAASREDAIVLVPQAYVRDGVWERLASVPSRVVMPGLAVLRGPLASPTELVPSAGLPTGQATWQVLGCILALVLLGGGYGGAVVLGRSGSVLDAIALAPSLGAVVVVVIGVVVSLVGGDPAEAAGLLLLGLGAAVGYLIAWRRRSPRTKVHATVT